MANRKLTKAQIKKFYSASALEYLGLKEGDLIKYEYLGDGFEDGNEDEFGRELMLVVENKTLKVGAHVNPFSGRRQEWSLKP